MPPHPNWAIPKVGGANRELRFAQRLAVTDLVALHDGREDRGLRFEIDVSDRGVADGTRVQPL